MVTKYFNLNNRAIVIECACSHPAHLLKFQVFINDSKELIVSTQLNSFLPWYRRIIEAFRFIFNKSPRFGHWDETIIKDKDINSIIELLKGS